MIPDPTSPTRHINKRLLLTLHQDGLLDILAGLIVITFGIIPLLDESGLGAGWRQVIFLSLYGIEVFGFLTLKKRICTPRIGMVILSRKKRRKLSLILLAFNLALFFFFIASYIFDLKIAEHLGKYQLSMMLGLTFMILLSVSGAMLNAGRFAVYGVIVFISFVGSEHLFLENRILHHGIPLATLISGGLMVLYGTYLLRRYIREYKIENQ